MIYQAASCPSSRNKLAEVVLLINLKVLHFMFNVYTTDIQFHENKIFEMAKVYKLPLTSS